MQELLGVRDELRLHRDGHDVHRRHQHEAVHERAVGPHHPEALDHVVANRATSSDRGAVVRSFVAQGTHRADRDPREQERQRVPRQGKTGASERDERAGERRPADVPRGLGSAEPTVGAQQVRAAHHAGQRRARGRVVQHAQRAHDERGRVEHEHRVAV